MLKKLLPGPYYLIQGLITCLQPGIRQVALLPIFLMFLFSSLMVGIAWWLIMPMFAPTSTVFSTDAYLLEVILSFFKQVFYYAMMLVCFIIATYLATLLTLISSTFFEDTLALRVIRLSHKDFETKCDNGIKRLCGQLYVLGKHFILLCFLSLTLWVIPLTQPAIPLLWLCAGITGLSWTYFDVSGALFGHSFSEVRAHLGARSWLNLTFGGSLLALNSIPGLGIILPPIAIAASALYWSQKDLG